MESLFYGVDRRNRIPDKDLIDEKELKKKTYDNIINGTKIPIFTCTT